MSSKRFIQNRNGAVSISTVFMLLGLVMLLSMGSDYAGTQQARAALNASADSAVLVAVGASTRGLDTGVVKKQAEDAFYAAVPKTSGLSVETVKVDVKDVGGQRSATVSYEANYSSMLMGSFGFPTLRIANSVAAKGPEPIYSDFYLLLDNSPSMGLGATQADIDLMNKKMGCAFACHQKDLKEDNHAKSKKIGATLRIDVVRQATQRVLDVAKETSIVPDQYRMGVYTFGTTAEAEGLEEVAAVSSDLGKVKSAAGKIDLMTMSKGGIHGYALTDFAEKLININKKISAPGDGLSPSNPSKFVFIVSDGVNNAPSQPTCARPFVDTWDEKGKKLTRCIEPMIVKLCDDIKKRGIKIAVLYTTYLPLPGNHAYDAYVKPFAGDINPKMKACASDDLFFEVSPSQGIAEAMQALFLKAARTAALTK